MGIQSLSFRRREVWREVLECAKALLQTNYLALGGCAEYGTTRLNHVLSSVISEERRIWYYHQKIIHCIYFVTFSNLSKDLI